MAVTFPTSPTNGQVFTANGLRYVYNATHGVWRIDTLPTASMEVSETPPNNPADGDMWFDPSVLETYVYYNDGDGSQWVISNPPKEGPAGADSTVPGPAGAAGADGASGIVQSQFTIKTTPDSVTANGTPTLVPDMSLTITPSSTSNKIYLTAQVSYSQLGTTYKAWFKRSVGGGAYEDVFVGDAAGNRQQASIPLALVTDTNQGNSFILQFIDEPATTSEIIYQLYVNNDNAIAFNINRSNADADSATGGRYVSTIIALELGA